MGIANRIPIGDSQVIAFISTVQLHHADFLSSEELIIWQKKNHNRKKMEWLSARFSAKIAALEWLKEVHNIELPPDKIIILNSLSGVPHFKLPLHLESPNLSLSHTDGKGLAAISYSSFIGCDIEKVKKRHPNFKKVFLTVKEIELWFQAEDIGNLNNDLVETLLWSAKESVIKAILSKQKEIEISFLDIQVSYKNSKDILRSLEFSTINYTGPIICLVMDSYIITIAKI